MNALTRLGAFFRAPSAKPRQIAWPAEWQEKGGRQLRHLCALLANQPQALANDLACGMMMTPLSAFESSQADAQRRQSSDAAGREAAVTGYLLSSLSRHAYLDAFAAHILTCLHGEYGWTWRPASREQLLHAARRAARFLADPDYRLTPAQLDEERSSLAAAPVVAPGAALALARQGRSDSLRPMFEDAMDRLAPALTEARPDTEAQEQRVYRTFMRMLRTDDCIGALLLHHLAVAYQRRGWAWQPTRAELHAIAADAASQLSDPRYRAALRPR